LVRSVSDHRELGPGLDGFDGLYQLGVHCQFLELLSVDEYNIQTISTDFNSKNEKTSFSFKNE
jgi:hypothetical protein